MLLVILPTFLVSFPQVALNPSTNVPIIFPPASFKEKLPKKLVSLFHLSITKLSGFQDRAIFRPFQPIKNKFFAPSPTPEKNTSIDCQLLTIVPIGDQLKTDFIPSHAKESVFLMPFHTEENIPFTPSHNEPKNPLIGSQYS